MNKEFYSNGKLLLSGEYAVLDGAVAWAIPTKFGQYLSVSNDESTQLSWKSLDEKGNLWFEATYTINNLEEIATSNRNTSETLQNILVAVRELNPGFLSDYNGYTVKTELTFPRDWGLGSSSTLINNIANWSKVNAHQLLSKTFGGSGYDIACAQHDTPILYQINKGLPIAEEIHKNPPFTEVLYFVYLNKKKNSREAINAYRNIDIDTSALVGQISKITKRMVTSSRIDDFEQLMTLHEQVLSEALGIPTIKAELFQDYTGAIKSLGAWGGDFILATGNEASMEYFRKKGYNTVIPYSEMIL